ncbi:MAG: 2TM domain-containing protein [Croceitalea sp.]|nr:2TM domain-containing protein [Croceitalea sp.]
MIRTTYKTLNMENMESKFERAAKRVKEMKGFYNHLKIFVIFNGGLYLIKSGWLNSLMPEGFPVEDYYWNWIDLNLLIWLGILVIHALILYRHKWGFLRKWEERQIQKILEQEREEGKK